MSTSDIWFASYLLFRGYKLSNFEIVKRGKGTYIFDMDEVQWKALKLEFSTSETNSIKAQHISLKDLLY